MKFGPVPLAQAAGKILGHNIAGPNGQRLLRKGRPLTEADLQTLAELGRASVYVAELTSDDVGENDAARRVAQALAGPGLRLPGAASGRANALAAALGLLRVDVERLNQLNEHEGLTVATLAAHSPVRLNQIVATVKIIPFALPEATVRAAEAIGARGGPLLRVDALPARSVSVIFSGSPALRDKLITDFAPLLERLEGLGAQVASLDFVPLEDESGEAALAVALQTRQAAGTQLIVLAGETAIMDRHDLVPRAVERAGGRVEALGAPVDPGNLLMIAYLGQVPIVGAPGCARSRRVNIVDWVVALGAPVDPVNLLMIAYLGQVPIVGAPGCARSRRVNIVDWVLPRLLAGDRLSRADLTGLGHGGLLEDAPERPMPRGAERDG